MKAPGPLAATDLSRGHRRRVQHDPPPHRLSGESRLGQLVVRGAALSLDWYSPGVATRHPYNLTSRPRPIQQAAGIYVRYVGITAGYTLAFAGWAILTLAEATPTVALLGLVPGLTGGLATAATAYHIIRRAEPLVTPLSDPRDSRGLPLLRINPNARAAITALGNTACAFTQHGSRS